MERKYGKITFPSEGLTITWEQFKKDFGGSEDFKNTPEENREAEMKKAFVIATKGATAEKDGDVSTAASKDKKDSAENAGK